MHDSLDEKFSYGDDTLPLVARVDDPPPSHWGKLTSTGRTCSPAYLKFIGKDKEDVSSTPDAG